MHPGNLWGPRRHCPPRDLARAQALPRLPSHWPERAEQTVPPQHASQSGCENGRARRARAACSRAGALPTRRRGAAVPPGRARRAGSCAALHVDLPGVSVALKSPREDEAAVPTAHAEDYWLPPGELSHIERRGGAGEHDVFRCFGCTRPACQVCRRCRNLPCCSHCTACSARGRGASYWTLYRQPLYTQGRTPGSSAAAAR
jgi:hypothetical protein